MDSVECQLFVMWFNGNIYSEFSQLKFGGICVKYYMAFIEPMHHNRPNISWVLTTHLTVIETRALRDP